jgi:hypothetical protein
VVSTHQVAGSTPAGGTTRKYGKAGNGPALPRKIVTKVLLSRLWPGSPREPGALSLLRMTTVAEPISNESLAPNDFERLGQSWRRRHRARNRSV